MAVVVKKKVVAVEPVPQDLSPIAVLIENYGAAAMAAAPVVKKIKELQAQLKPFKDAQTDLEQGIEALDLPDDVEEALIHMSTGFRCEIGSKGAKREVTDIAKAKELLTEPLFMQLAKVALGDLDKYLTLPQRELCVTTTRTTNTYKVVPKVAPKGAK